MVSFLQNDSEASEVDIEDDKKRMDPVEDDDDPLIEIEDETNAERSGKAGARMVANSEIKVPNY